MNDPLRDNRIFPEEMQQQPAPKTQKSSNLTWLWVALLIIGILALAWFGYRYYQNNMQPEPTVIPETVIPTQKVQQEIIDDVVNSAPPLERVERQQQINTLFGN